MSEDRIKRCLSKHPEWSDYRISHSLAVPSDEVKAVRALYQVRPGETIYPGHPKADPPAPAGLISLASVRDRLDIAAAIQREISRMKRGSLVVEDEMCRLTAGKDRNRFRRAVDNNPDLAKRCRVKLRLEDSGEGRHYWGHESDVAEALRMRDL